MIVLVATTHATARENMAVNDQVVAISFSYFEIFPTVCISRSERKTKRAQLIAVNKDSRWTAHKPMQDDHCVGGGAGGSQAVNRVCKNMPRYGPLALRSTRLVLWYKKKQDAHTTTLPFRHFFTAQDRPTTGLNRRAVSVAVSQLAA